MIVPQTVVAFVRRNRIRGPSFAGPYHVRPTAAQSTAADPNERTTPSVSARDAALPSASLLCRSGISGDAIDDVPHRGCSWAPVHCAHQEHCGDATRGQRPEEQQADNPVVGGGELADITATLDQPESDQAGQQGGDAVAPSRRCGPHPGQLIRQQLQPGAGRPAVARTGRVTG